MFNFILGPIASFLMNRRPSLTKSHATRLAKIIAVVGLIIICVVSLIVLDHFNDKRAVKGYKKDVIIEEQAETIESNNRANRGEEVRRDDRETAEDQSRESLEDIHEQDPENAQAPATRGNRAVADRLR